MAARHVMGVVDAGHAVDEASRAGGERQHEAEQSEAASARGFRSPEPRTALLSIGKT